MLRILTPDEMYRCDSAAIAAGTPSRTLMTRASAACADGIADLLLSGQTCPYVLVLCGTGNNGGDGICCARLLRERGIPADICMASVPEPAAMSAECAYQYEMAQAAGVPVLVGAVGWREDYTCIVDALFGIGLSREPGGAYAALIDAANRYAEEQGIPVAAIDIPSGVNALTGEVYGHAVRADLTFAISHSKRGHLLYPGASYCGRIVTLDIGISDAPLAAAEGIPLYALEDGDTAALLPARMPDSNKGTYGRVLVIAGSKNMCGAAYLSAKAAYRTGAGLVEVFTCEENRIPMQTLLAEAVLTTYQTPEAAVGDALSAALRRADAVVLGPGLGQSETALALTRQVLALSEKPTVIDADALNLMAAHGLLPLLRARAEIPWILTPHPGELSRLTGMTVSALKEDFIGCAVSFAAAHGVILNAKDSRSVITDGRCAYLNTSGCSAMAKGGSGDVLTGIIAALAAQGCDPLCAAALGAFLHGRAGEAAAEKYGTRGMLAGECADALCEVIG